MQDIIVEVRQGANVCRFEFKSTYLSDAIEFARTCLEVGDVPTSVSITTVKEDE